MEFTNVEDTSSQKMNVPLSGSVLQSASSVENDEPLNFDDELGDINPTVIKIIGCGGGGSSAVQRMIEDGVSGVQFIVLNTDKQALHKSTAQLRVPIGQKITGGLGAGGNPAVGENAAKEDAERISRIISGANMVIITAGMGGGTGTGSEGIQSSRHDGLEEFDRACLTKKFYGSSIDEQCKSVESHIQNDQLGSQRQDRLGSVGFYNRYDGTEDTDRGKIHHGTDDLQTYLVTGINQM